MDILGIPVLLVNKLLVMSSRRGINLNLRELFAIRLTMVAPKITYLLPIKRISPTSPNYLFS